MRILALDISTKTGWAIFNDGVAQPVSFGVRVSPIDVNESPYPINFLFVARAHATWIKNLIRTELLIDGRSLNNFDAIVI